MPTQQQIQQLANLQQAYQTALADWQQAVEDLAAARNAALACQAARDQYSLGWKRNQACDINVLGQLNNAWGNAETVESAKRKVKDTAYDAIASFQQQIDTQTQQGINELQLDPSFNLQTQQINANANVAAAAAAAKAKAEADAAKRKQLLIFGLIGLGLAVVVVIVVVVVKNKK